MKTVGEVSALAGITVRTLHHYDALGLLSPSCRTETGYRLYSNGDLERLQEILGWRALGFSLEEIGELLDETGRDRLSALRMQRELVDAELARLTRLAHALEQAIVTTEQGQTQQEEAMFSGFDPSEHEDEARERWATRRPTRSRRVGWPHTVRSNGARSKRRLARLRRG